MSERKLRASLIAAALSMVATSPHEARRKTDDESLRLAELFLITAEGVVLGVYDDGYGYETVGIGHRWKHGERVPKTVEEALDLLRSDIGKHAHCVERFKPMLTACQYAALVSFVFNIGCANFNSSRNSVRLKLEAGLIDEVPARMRLFNKARDRATGQLVVDQGLINRRAAEIELWSGTWDYRKWLQV